MRTTNSAEQTDAGRIPGHWQRFLSENVAGRILRRLDGATVALYTDYAGDENGEYSLVLGARVDAGTEIPGAGVPGTGAPGTLVPEGMVLKEIPASRYQVITSERGPVWKVVPEAWRQVWANPPASGRSFVGDFEVYDERAQDPGDAVVELWIGIR